MYAAQEAFRTGSLDPRLVSVRRHPDLDLHILNYTRDCMEEGIWNEVTRFSRGLILDSAGNIHARSFAKFFNVGERDEVRLENLPQEPFRAFSKYDGSLGVFYRGAGSSVQVATRGAFESPQAIWASAWVGRLSASARATLRSVMDAGLTPVVEIVYAGVGDTVIKYPFEGLVLIALIENATGDDRPWEEVEALGVATGIRCAETYEFASIAEVIVKKHDLAASEEGFVIRYVSGLRVKVKGDGYLRLFRALQGLTVGRVLEEMKAGNENYFRSLPEEIRPLGDAIRAQIEAQKALIEAEARQLCAAMPKGVSRKEIAAWMEARPASLPAKELAFLLMDNRQAKWRWDRRIDEKSIKVPGL